MPPHPLQQQRQLMQEGLHTAFGFQKKAPEVQIDMR